MKMKAPEASIFLVMFLLVCNTFGAPVYNSGLLGIEEATNNLSSRNLDLPNEVEEQQHNEDNVQEIDPRLLEQSFSEEDLAAYTCTGHEQCVNGGSCVDTGKAGKICNCTADFFGPFCDYSTSYIERALRLHPAFKILFAECMINAGQSAGVNTTKVLATCGGAQNLCWLHEGGIRGLKCFFWCLTNGMHLSLTEAQPSEPSRLHLYADVFRKLSSERHLDGRGESSEARRIPIYSMEISLFETSQSNLKKQQFLPQITINTNPQAWASNFNPYPPPIPPIPKPLGPPYVPEFGFANKGLINSQKAPLKHRQVQYPKSHEITPNYPENDDPEEQEFDYTSLAHYLPQNPYDEEPTHGADRTPEGRSPDRNFLNDAIHDVIVDLDNNVVESVDETTDDETMTSHDQHPEFDLSKLTSNMRDGMDGDVIEG